MDYFVWKFVSHFKLGSGGLSSFPRKEFKIRYVDFWTNINITQRKLLYTLSKTDQLWLSNVKNNLSLSDLVIDFFKKNFNFSKFMLRKQHYAYSQIQKFPSSMLILAKNLANFVFLLLKTWQLKLPYFAYLTIDML